MMHRLLLSKDWWDPPPLDRSLVVAIFDLYLIYISTARVDLGKYEVHFGGLVR